MRNRASTPLKKARVRQSWSKYNLYNLCHVQPIPFRGKTHFQQKWKAKSALRDYHGEQVREGQWSRMFRRTLRSVVPMDPVYLATNDGSLESQGRGSGLKRNELVEDAPRPIPYMQMTFAPLERRLDTAVFRAMFASSARQARQFVVHGAVTVNGKKMNYPGYLLNPGDMFQVNPERVMYATGQPKGFKPFTPSESDGSVKAKEDDDADKAEPDSEIVEVDIEREPREILKDLLSQSKSVLASPREKLGAKRKQDLRAFSSAVRSMLSRSKSATIMTDSLEAQFQEIQHQLKISKANKKAGRSALPSEQKGQNQDQHQDVEAETAVEETKEGEPVEEVHVISDADYAQLYSALTQMQENPVDDSKPYATPWTPRDYMSAFAMIPRYLEVNHNICAAVYLRHPVARPGAAEIPTPWGVAQSAIAYAWYLRRR